jgi:pimeloyl-ACP methyl ester carboxylesterase
LKEARKPGPIAPPGWPLAAVLPVAVGVLWLWWDVRSGLSGVLVGGLPGTLLVATGLSNLLWAGDARIFHFMSLGAISGVVLSFPAALVLGPTAAAVLVLLSAASFVAAGYLAVGQEPIPPGVPEPQMNLRMAARAAEDELSMCCIVLSTWPLTVGSRAARIGEELEDALTLFKEKGWLDDPASYHRTPPPITEMGSGDLRHPEPGFEHVTFESAYEPWPEEQGRDRWLSYERNRTAHAWVLRHPGEPRPWVVCVHGIRVGSPRGNLAFFRPDYLHRGLGLNILFPVLPIHGPRRIGPVSGDRILSGDVMDTLHAGAQAMWDIRRLLGWLHTQEEATAVGVLGHSLGGYVAALLCCLEDGVDGVVVANPAVDPSHLFWRNALSLATRYLKTAGVTEEKMDVLLRVVSPLAMAPLLSRERRAIFAGIADRVVPAVEANSLWHHWAEPRITWYQGTHRAFLSTTEGRTLIATALRDAGVLPKESA